MGAIPPGPQVPFSKDRSYGQEPGVISRHKVKILVVFAMLVAVAILGFMSASASQGDRGQGQSSIPTPARR